MAGQPSQSSRKASIARVTRHASESKFAIASTTRPSRFVTRAISAIALSGSSKWSIAPLQNEASNESFAKGNESAQPLTHSGLTCPSSRFISSKATAIAVILAESCPTPLATSKINRPGSAQVASSVASVIRANRNSLSGDIPVGITSLMSRSRSTTRMGADVSGVWQTLPRLLGPDLSTKRYYNQNA
jgi:hypothetical protein